MHFGPCFHKALLTLGKTPSNQLQRLQAVDGDVFLIVCVEVRKMMRGVRLGEHSNDYSEEAAQFGHWLILIHPCCCAKGGATSRRSLQPFDRMRRDLLS